jgi:hypothetical protein
MAESLRVSGPPNNALDRVLAPKQTLGLGIALFLIALYPLLTLRVGRPTSWFGEFVFLFCACISFVASPGFTVALFWDILRRKAGPATFSAFVLSMAAVAAISSFIYLRIRQG